MPVSILPPELLDIVFANLQPRDSTNPREAGNWPIAQEVRESLSACTLVSRSWYPLAREHLFRNVVYSFQRSPKSDDRESWGDVAPRRWTEYLACPALYGHGESYFSHLPLKTLQMFFDFLQLSPVVRRSIRKLTLSCYPAGGPSGLRPAWPSKADDDDAVDPALLASLISSLPCLESVRLYDVVVSEPRAAESSLPPISVREVHIVSRRFLIPTRMVCDLTSFFGDVGKYTLTNVCLAPMDYLPNHTTLPDEFPSSVALNAHSVTISHFYNDGPLRIMSHLLQKSPFVHNLRRLCITATALAATPGITAMLESCGSYLQYLKLVISCPIDDEGFLGQILDLSSLSNLQELAIGFSAEVKCDQMTLHPWMSEFVRYFNTMVLSPSTNPNLRKLTLCLICDDPWIPPIDPERAYEHHWGDPYLLSDIAEFETHFANLVHRFGLDGIYVECNTMPNVWGEFSSRVRLRSALPLIFPMLAQEKLLISGDYVPGVV